MSRSFDDNLALFADLTIREGVNLQAGQELIVAADLGDAPLVRLVTQAAYRAGATNVQVMWRDEACTLAKFELGSDAAIEYAPQWLFDGYARAYAANAARLAITSDNPMALANQDPKRIAAASRATGIAGKEAGTYISGMKINWCVVGAASPGWAKQVFPELPIDQAVAKLWDAIFLTSRVLEDDPIATWQAHVAHLEARMARLNDQRFDALHFRGPGTDLRVGLVPDHIWVGGRGFAKNGVACSPNIPTEEIFTMPHRMRTDGVVSSSKPLSLRGQVVDGIRVEFKDGAVVGASATSGEATLIGLLDSDDGSRRLGEVALVPNSCAVSRAGILFYNTLYDENAASHIALGNCYAENLSGYDAMTDDARIAAGANDSIIHVDWMIGSGEVDVDGIGFDGSATPLMRAGEWV